jgi:general secretion pathway protein B
MSFILDALKKSETERQQKGSTEFAGVPTSSGNRESAPRWLWLLGALLMVNLLVLVVILLRPDVSPNVPTTTAADATPVIENNFAEKVAAAKENAPPREERATIVPEREPTPVVEPAPARTQASANIQPGIVTIASEPIESVSLPTAQEVQANGTVSLPELHVDIHVYSETPEDRFVFINMTKHNEGSRLPEGPLVVEITTEGVVLQHNGTQFLLPRD